MSPLVMLTFLGIVVGGIGAALYWTSQPLTKTITVTGFINAATNFNNDDLIDVTSFVELEAKCHSDLNTAIRVASDGSNADVCYTTLNIDCPPGASVTAVVGVYKLTNGVPDTGTPLGSIATDGSESVKVTRDGNDRWFYESDYPNGVCHVLCFIITWDTASLPVGVHDFSGTVTLGDDL